jgi:hypothetical protein
LSKANGKVASVCKAKCPDIVLCGGNGDCASIGSASTCQPENTDLYGLYTACTM